MVLGGASLVFVLIFLKYHPWEETPGMNQTYWIPASELQQVQAAADAGDTKAALRLARHYGFGYDDLPKMLYYTYIAAKAGDQEAKLKWEILASEYPAEARMVEQEYTKPSRSGAPSTRKNGGEKSSGEP